MAARHIDLDTAEAGRASGGPLHHISPTLRVPQALSPASVTTLDRYAQAIPGGRRTSQYNASNIIHSV